ncbi:MAG: hypothetical protein U0930_11440 [Pirellulales bacterium]
MNYAPSHDHLGICRILFNFLLRNLPEVLEFMFGIWKAWLWREVSFRHQLTWSQFATLQSQLLKPWIGFICGPLLLFAIGGFTSVRLVEVGSNFAICWNCLVAIAIAVHLSSWWSDRYTLIHFFCQTKAQHLPISDECIGRSAIYSGLKGYLFATIPLAISLIAICWTLNFPLATKLWLVFSMWQVEVLILFLLAVVISKIASLVIVRIPSRLQLFLFERPYLKLARPVVTLFAAFTALGSLFVPARYLNQFADVVGGIASWFPTTWPVTLVAMIPESSLNLSLVYMVISIGLLFVSFLIIERQLRQVAVGFESYLSYMSTLLQSLSESELKTQIDQDELKVYRRLHQDRTDVEDQLAARLARFGFTPEQTRLLQMLQFGEPFGLLSATVLAILGSALAALVWLVSFPIAIGTVAACIFGLTLLQAKQSKWEKFCYLPVSIQQVLWVDLKSKFYQSIRWLLAMLPALVIIAFRSGCTGLELLTYAAHGGLVVTTGLCLCCTVSLLMRLDISAITWRTLQTLTLIAVTFLTTVTLGFLTIFGASYAWLLVFGMLMTLTWHWRITISYFNQGADLRMNQKI